MWSFKYSFNHKGRIYYSKEQLKTTVKNKLSFFWSKPLYKNEELMLQINSVCWLYQTSSNDVIYGEASAQVLLH